MSQQHHIYAAQEAARMDQLRCDQVAQDGQRRMQAEQAAMNSRFADCARADELHRLGTAATGNGTSPT